MNYRLRDDYWRRDHRFELRAGLDPQVVEAALASLRSAIGVLELVRKEKSIHIVYDLRLTNLLSLKRLMMERGLDLQESFFLRIYHYIEQYRESIRLEEQHLDYGWDTWIQDAYVSRYRRRRHGHRDDRITNWRDYEPPEDWPKPE